MSYSYSMTIFKDAHRVRLISIHGRTPFSVIFSHEMAQIYLEKINFMGIYLNRE